MEKNNNLITKEMLKKESSWSNAYNFTACLDFKEFPKELLEKHKELIDVDKGYLCCEYCLSDDDSGKEGFFYSFNFEYDNVPVNDVFRTPELDSIIKELATESKMSQN